MAIKDGRILHVGSNDDIRNMANSSTQIIDAQGKTVFPGFQDTHMHLQDSGAEIACGPALLPEQRLSVDQVVKGYTIHAAECAWRADVTGSLEKGKYADYIIVDADPYKTDLYDLGKIKVEFTVLEGREVYRRDSFTG